MFKLLLASAAALASVASAQTDNGTATPSSNNIGPYSTSGPLSITPSYVDIALRTSWCQGQTNTCPFVCAGPDANQGDAYPNSCDPQTLTYECVCKNGNKPNMSAYEMTLPFYICQQWIIDCTAAHPNDLQGQLACQSVKCGGKNATAQSDASTNGGSSSASASGGSSSPSQTASGTSGGSASASSESASASSTPNAAVALGFQFGSSILVAGLLALFGLGL